MKTTALILIGIPCLRIIYGKTKGLIQAIRRRQTLLKRGYHSDDVFIANEEQQKLSPDEIENLKKEQYQWELIYTSEEIHFWFLEILFFVGVEIAVIVELTEKFIN